MRIGLLECDDVSGRFQGAEGGYRDMFADLLSPHVPGLELVFYEAHRGNLPQAASDCDAWLCTGSRFSVYQDLPWVHELADFVRSLRAAGPPFVGICFGHQMLAQALGGEVGPAPGGWGVGVLRVDVERPEDWMQPPQPVLHLHHMHADQILALPEASVVLARSGHCEVEMFRVGETMLGIESHPEFTAAFAGALIRDRHDDIGAERAAQALASLERPDDGALLGGWIARFIGR